jgi:hypothetical protein
MKRTCDICQKKRKDKHFGSSTCNVLWCDDCIAKCPPPAPTGQSVRIGPPSWGSAGLVPTSQHLPFYLMDRADWPTYGFHPAVITQGAPLHTPKGTPQGAPQSHQPQSAQGQIQTLLNTLNTSGGLTPASPPPPDVQCDNCGGPWGDDETCEKCTDENGDPRPHKKPRPKPKHLTGTQHVSLHSDLERMKLQLKAGLDDNGRPLKDDERKRLERQVEIHSQELTDDEEARVLLGVDDPDAEIRRLLGIDP